MPKFGTFAGDLNRSIVADLKHEHTQLGHFINVPNTKSSEILVKLDYIR